MYPEINRNKELFNDFTLSLDALALQNVTTASYLLKNLWIAAVFVLLSSSPSQKIFTLEDY